MKIGINSRMYQNSNTGIPYYIEYLYKTCIKKDKMNEYVFFQTSTKKIIGKTLLAKLTDTNISAFMFDNFLVSKLINREKIGVYHAPANILPFFKKKNVKYILTVHDLSFLIFPKDNSAIFNFYYKHAVGRSLKMADIIVSDSENTKKDIIRFYNISYNKIKVVYPGLNKVYSNNSKTTRIIKKKYFFTLSTHPKRKNIYRIIEILANNKDLNNIQFVIAGLISKDQIFQLESVIAKLNMGKRVILFGYATEKELVNLYTYAEFFIYPSYYEGFGFPVVEAMASKCPVIGSNTSSIPELMPDKSWLVDPHSSEKIAILMKKMLNLSLVERKKIIDKNYNFVKKFSWEKSAEEMIKLFKS